MSSTPRQQKWLESLGGPWILAPASQSKHWGGHSKASFFQQTPTDYECLGSSMLDANGRSTYIAALGKDQNWLGIGEMAAGMCALDLDVLGSCLVEWFGAENDDALAERLSATKNRVLLNEVDFNSTEAEYVIFDSVWQLIEAPEKAALLLAPGSYTAKSEVFKLDDDEFAVTSFLPTTQAI